MATWWVTSQISLGDPPPKEGCVQTESAAEALEIIAAGGTAVLPVGAWDLADEVMWLRGSGPRWRAHQLHWARTGTIGLAAPSDVDDPESPVRRPPAEATGAWPDPPDGQKAGPQDVLDRDRADLAHEGGAREEAVLGMVDFATRNGLPEPDAWRRALDETAASDAAFDAMLAERLGSLVEEDSFVSLEDLDLGL